MDGMQKRRAFDVAALGRALGDAFGERVSRAPAVREQHGRDESAHPPAPPDYVVFARSTEDVAQAVGICADFRAPVIAFGAGTSLEGHVQAIHGGVSIDLAGMDRVIEVRPEDQDVTVEAGITRKALNHWLRDTGLFFPVDPGADATLGGMAATGASGTTTVRYGTMRENVLTAKVVLADGSVVTLGSRARKSSAGYDLLHLLVGSEGTLGIMTELTLRLHGRPEAVAAGVAPFATLEGLVEAVIEAIQCEVPLARIELLDHLAVMAVNAYAGLANTVAPTLFLEFHGSEPTIAHDLARFEEIARAHGCTGFEAATMAEGRAKLWKARHEALYAGRALNPGRIGLITDVCVPISKLAESILATRADLARSGIVAAIVGHVGDGNYHTTLWLDPDDEAGLERARGIIERMAERAIALGGTCTGEHGIGLGKMALLAREHGDSLAMMRAVKRALDPDNILNPGKVLAHPG